MDATNINGLIEPQQNQTQRNRPTATGLNKTFKVKLVAPDANDGPAEVLLEWVKKSRRDETMLERSSRSKTPKGRHLKK